jgi:hypothetical protein
MRRRQVRIAVVWACLMMVGLVHTGAAGGPPPKKAVPPVGAVYSPNAFKVPYLGLDGVFTLDQNELSATDPRNPPRVAVRQMEVFAFYADLAGATPLAEDCHYVYKGAEGDPFYYPNESKTSIWDLFEFVSGDGDCKAFYYLIIRAPHGDPVHMHLRYGDERSSFRQLLEMSDGPEDKTKLDPWWSVYCAEGVSGCD